MDKDKILLSMMIKKIINSALKAWTGKEKSSPAFNHFGRIDRDTRKDSSKVCCLPAADLCVPPPRIPQDI